MDIQTAADVQKLHAAFVKSINAMADTLLAESKLNPSDVLRDKRQMLKAMQDQLDEVTTARAGFERAYDREIAQRQKAIDGVTAEVNDDAKDLDRLTRAVKSARAAKTARVAKTPRGAVKRAGKKKRTT